MLSIVVVYSGVSHIAYLAVLHTASIYIYSGKESSLVPTLRSENLAGVLAECFSLHQGES